MATLDPNIVGIIAAPVQTNTLILFNRDVFKTTSPKILLVNDHIKLQYYTLMDKTKRRFDSLFHIQPLVQSLLYWPVPSRKLYCILIMC